MCHIRIYKKSQKYSMKIVLAYLAYTYCIKYQKFYFVFKEVIVHSTIYRLAIGIGKAK